MIQQFRIFLGPERVRWLFLLLAFTGLGNLLLNVVVNEVAWAKTAQTALVFVFIIGAAIIVGTRLDTFERGRLAGLLAPALIALLIGLFIAPDLLALMAGGAVGWVIAGLFIFRPRGPMQYQQAVKHLRKNEYADAIKVLDELIQLEPERTNHYRFRAEILRLWGKLDRARRDYEKMTQVATNDSERAVAFNGLAEVLLQSGDYEKAQQAGKKAYDLAPNEWVAAYNLGMIEDRLRDAESAVEHLTQALNARVPDARHRVLIHFYLARAYARQQDFEAAQEAVELIKRHRGGLNEWQVILQSDQADTLRAVIEQDIQAAEALADGEMPIETLSE